MTKIAEFLLKGYRLLISPVLHAVLIFPGGCRFYPTCSDYGLRAVRQYGLIKGLVLLLKRLARCRPGSSGGCDPLPSTRGVFLSRTLESH